MKNVAGIIQLAILALTAAFGLSVLGATTSPARISVTELTQDRLVGQFGAPLGTYMDIKGTRKENLTKRPRFLLLVDEIDGKKLRTAVEVEIRGLERYEMLPMGTEFTIRGYEWGAMEGDPIDPKLPDDASAHLGVGFLHWFEAAKVLSPEAPAK